MDNSEAVKKYRELFEVEISVEEIRLERRRLQRRREKLRLELLQIAIDEDDLHDRCPHDNMQTDLSGCDDPIFVCPDCGYTS